MKKQASKEGVRKRLLLVGHSSIHRGILKKLKQSYDVHVYDSLVDLLYNKPPLAYDGAVVGYEYDDRESVEAARYLTSYFRKMGVFIVSIQTKDKEKYFKYEKGGDFRFVADRRDVMRAVTAASA